MPDLIPEGCISLRAAFDRFALWGGDSPVAVLRDLDLSKAPHRVVAERTRASVARVMDSMLWEFGQSFRQGDLDALVREPGATENSAVPADSWETSFFTERAFLADEVAAGHDGYWSAMAGRTPFVRRDQFEPWLAVQVRRRADPRPPATTATQALRTELISLATDGLVPSAQVEQWAEVWGMAPFASKPPFDRFDPLKLSRWTLCMAACWMVWRSLDEVRDAIDNYRTSCWVWSRCERRLPVKDSYGWYDVRGEELIALTPLTLSGVGLVDPYRMDPSDSSQTMSIGEARDQLWRCLGDDDLSASGLNSSDQVVEIPAREWAYLELAGDLDGNDYLVFAKDRSRTAYTGMTVARAAVLERWKPLEEAVADQPVLIPKARRVGKLSKTESTKKAIAALYQEGIPAGRTDKDLLGEVNAWHRDQRNSEIAISTLRRVLKDG